VARNWASSSGKLAVYSSLTMHIYSGFINDINLITYGPTAAENCRTLEKAYNTYIEWARQYGVQFSPEKYQLIHFIRKHNQSTDL